MKKLLCILVVLVMVFVIAACDANVGSSGGGTSGGGAAPPAESPPPSGGTEPTEDVIVLKLAHNQAPQSISGLQYELFAETVKKLSGGSLMIEIFPSGTLIADAETLDSVIEGVVDMVHILASFASGTVKDMGPLEMFGYYIGDDWLGFLDKSRPLLDKIYEPYGIKFLGSGYQGTITFICADRQIMTPDDMKGLTFRSAGTWYGRCIETMGGAATQLFLPELPQAMERGTVNGTIVGWNVIYPLSLYESADYISATTAMTYYTNLMMNMDSFNKLTAEQQQDIEEAALVFEKEGFFIGDVAMPVYREGIEEAGNSIVDLSAEELGVFLDLVDPLYDEMTDLTENGKQLVALIREEQRAWRAAN